MGDYMSNSGLNGILDFLGIIEASVKEKSSSGELQEVYDNAKHLCETRDLKLSEDEIKQILERIGAIVGEIDYSLRDFIANKVSKVVFDCVEVEALERFLYSPQYGELHKGFAPSSFQERFCIDSLLNRVDPRGEHQHFSGFQSEQDVEMFIDAENFKERINEYYESLNQEERDELFLFLLDTDSFECGDKRINCENGEHVNAMRRNSKVFFAIEDYQTQKRFTHSLGRYLEHDLIESDTDKLKCVMLCLRRKQQ